jgi:glycosyltransferase involved in cell wall biosynthesis
MLMNPTETMGDVTVITPTLPERTEFLEQCTSSVLAQTVKVTHLVGVDEKRRGPQQTRNELASGVSTEWVLPLDDDDVLDTDFVATLLDRSADADVVYPFTRMVGRTDWCPNRLFNPRMLFRRNFIPVTALIRKDLFDMLGGYRKVPLEDWDLWQRAFLHGAKFKCVPEVLWSYRFHEGNEFQAASA